MADTISETVRSEAAASGFELSEEADGLFLATHSDSSRTIAADDPKAAWSILQQVLDWEADFRKDHPNAKPIHIDSEVFGEGEDDAGPGDYVATQDGVEIARDPDFDDLLTTLAERIAEGGGDLADEAEEEGKGSCVPPKYKAIYAERGNPTHCGDWLAETLNALCRVKDDKGKETTDLDRLEAIAAANEVAPDRVDRLGKATNGWQGRYRMTVRNMLTPRVAAKGFLFVPEGCGRDSDTEISAPVEWCREKAPKPREDKAKRAKATKEAASAAQEADPTPAAEQPAAAPEATPKTGRASTVKLSVPEAEQPKAKRTRKAK